MSAVGSKTGMDRFYFTGLKPDLKGGDPKVVPVPEIPQPTTPSLPNLGCRIKSQLLELQKK